MILPNNNLIGECFARAFGESCTFIDSNNVLWKIVNNEWVGKRSVLTFDYSSVWLEDTKPENVKSWSCGKDADYSEIFKNK